MIEIRTTCNGETIVWQVTISVAMRREIHEREALYLLGEQLVVNTHAVLEVVVPEGIADVTADGERRGGAQVPALQNGNGEAVAEWAWGLPMLHLDSLATQVGSYLYTGIEPGAEPEEDDDGPLVERSASSGRATDSTRPEGGSAEGDTPSPT